MKLFKNALKLWFNYMIIDIKSGNKCFYNNMFTQMKEDTKTIKWAYKLAKIILDK